jgi:hypothetical protein
LKSFAAGALLADDDVLEAGRGGQDDELAAAQGPRRLPARDAVSAASAEHDNAVRARPMRARPVRTRRRDDNNARRREGVPRVSMKRRLVEAAAAVEDTTAVEAGVMRRAALEGAGGSFPGSIPLGAMEGMPAVSLHGMESARPETVHSVTGEAMIALDHHDALGRPAIAVDEGHGRWRPMAGDGVLPGQRKHDAGEQEHHHHCPCCGATHGDPPQSGLRLVEAVAGL